MTPHAIGMDLKTSLAWALAHPELAILIVGAIVTAITSAYAAAKIAYQKTTGRAAKGGVWTALDVVLVELLPNVPGAINRLLRWRGLPSLFALPTAAPSTPPVAPSNPQSGRSTPLVMLALVAAFGVGTGATLVCCGPRPVPVDGGPAVTPSSWTDGARVALTTLAFAVPAAKAIVQATVADPGRTQVVRALDATAEASRRMEEALVAYERAGGDGCLAKSATAGLHAAIVVLAQTLADNGIALGTTLERIADALAAVVDILTPGCAPDAALASSAGDASNARLRDIAAGARARGVILSRVLDDLHPLAVDAGVR